jgi:hypothetical protein
MAERTTLPNGFSLKAVETEAAGHKYTVEVPQAESLQAVLDAYKEAGKNGEEILLAIWNSGNEQGAKQGQKTPVREAVEGPDGEQGEGEEKTTKEERIQKAVEKHQAAARQFIQGAPRGGGGQKHESGLTKKQREDLGTKIAMEMATTGAMPSRARMEEIAKELGIDPAAMGA